MKAKHHYFSRLRFIFTLLLGILPILLTACSSTHSHSHSGWYSSDTADFSKIYVEPFLISPDAHLPNAHADSGLVMTYVLGQRLAERNLLQTNLKKIALRISGIFLYYHDGVLDLTADLWDGDKYLTYSQIQHRFDPKNDWNQEIAVIGAELLDDLMQKLSFLGETEYNAYLFCPNFYFGGGGFYGGGGGGGAHAGNRGYESTANRSTSIIRHPDQTTSRHELPETHGRDDHRHENGRNDGHEQNSRSGHADSGREVFGGNWSRHDQEMVEKEKSAPARDNHAGHEANSTVSATLPASSPESHPNSHDGSEISREHHGDIYGSSSGGSPTSSEHWSSHETDNSRHEATSGVIALPTASGSASGNTAASSHSSSSIGLPSVSSPSTFTVPPGSSSSSSSAPSSGSSSSYSTPSSHSSYSYSAPSSSSSSSYSAPSSHSSSSYSAPSSSSSSSSSGSSASSSSSSASHSDKHHENEQHH